MLERLIATKMTLLLDLVRRHIPECIVDVHRRVFEPCPLSIRISIDRGHALLDPAGYLYGAAPLDLVQN